MGLGEGRVRHRLHNTASRTAKQRRNLCARLCMHPLASRPHLPQLLFHLRHPAGCRCRLAPVPLSCLYCCPRSRLRQQRVWVGRGAQTHSSALHHSTHGSTATADATVCFQPQHINTANTSTLQTGAPAPPAAAAPGWPPAPPPAARRQPEHPALPAALLLPLGLHRGRQPGAPPAGYQRQEVVEAQPMPLQMQGMSSPAPSPPRTLLHAVASSQTSSSRLTFWSNRAFTRSTSSPTQAIMPSFSAAAASAAVARAAASAARRSASASRRSS